MAAAKAKRRRRGGLVGSLSLPLPLSLSLSLPLSLSLSLSLYRSLARSQIAAMNASIVGLTMVVLIII